MKKASYTYLCAVAATVLLVVMAVCFISCGWKAVRQTTPLLLRADTLMLSAPDSALRLLESVSPMPEWTDRLCSDYVLRLAEARDKCSLPLLPCDSLLNIALAYYDNDDAGRPLALLYKARLEDQMGQYERASKRLTEGLELLERHPQGAEVRRNMLSTLGAIYYNSNLYQEAFLTYKEMYKFCFADKDKAIAMNNLSSYYYATDQEDSCLIYMYKALNQAISSKDSKLTSNFYLNLSVDCETYGKTDSAIQYLKKAFMYYPQEKYPGNYYLQQSDLLLRKDMELYADSALIYLHKCMEDTAFKDRYICLQTASEIAKEKGDAQAALTYLTAYTDALDSIITSEQATDVENIMYEYKTHMRMQDAQMKSRQEKTSILITAILLCLLLIIYYQHRISKKKQQEIKDQHAIEEARKITEELQKRINESQDIIHTLNKKSSSLEEEQENKNSLIKAKEQEIIQLQAEQQRLHCWLFTHTDLYKKIQTLAKQKDKKDMKVLNLSEQKELRKMIFDLYATNITTLKEKHPYLNDEDILLLCLQETSLTSKAIALCFGYSDTHPINQRKQRMKEKADKWNKKET